MTTLHKAFFCKDMLLQAILIAQTRLSISEVVNQAKEIAFKQERQIEQLTKLNHQLQYNLINLDKSIAYLYKELTRFANPMPDTHKLIETKLATQTRFKQQQMQVKNKLEFLQSADHQHSTKLVLSGLFSRIPVIQPSRHTFKDDSNAALSSSHLITRRNYLHST